MQVIKCTGKCASPLNYIRLLLRSLCLQDFIQRFSLNKIHDYINRSIFIYDVNDSRQNRMIYIFKNICLSFKTL